MEDRDLNDFLNDDPFENEVPSKFELYLNVAMKLAFANIGAISHNLEQLNRRMNDHEQAHAAASSEALKMPDVPEKEEKPN